MDAPLAIVVPEVYRSLFFPAPLWEELNALAPRLVWLPPEQSSPDVLLARLADLDPEVVITSWGTPSLESLTTPRLRYVCHLCGSVRTLVTREQIAGGLRVTNWGGAISRTVAEAVLLHILAGLRRLPDYVRGMPDGYWRGPVPEGRSLYGRRVGVHGFGQVARALLPLLRPFGVEVRIHAPDAQEAAALGAEAVPTLEDLFAGSDIVVELAPLIPETRRIVTESLLRRLPEGGLFINVGRGSIVDEEALTRVAKEGTRWFGLDVFEDEPLPADHPLRSLPNVLLTPHVAGPTQDRCVDAGRHGLDNVRRYATGQSLHSEVTPERYDLAT